METYFDFAVDRFRRPQSTWVNRSLRLAFKVVLNFLEALTAALGNYGQSCNRDRTRECPPTWLVNIYRGGRRDKGGIVSVTI